MITRLDYRVGQLLDKLKELKIDDNTIIFFTSDNGPHKEGGVDPKILPERRPFARDQTRPIRRGHPGALDRSLARARSSPDGSATSVRSFWDFLPTAAEIAQTRSTSKTSTAFPCCRPCWARPQTNQHEFLYWEFHERGFQQAVRMGDWKAVRPQAGEPLELYNLADRSRRETECGRAAPRGRGQDRRVPEDRPDRLARLAN